MDNNGLIERYIALWNEADAERRRELIARTFTENARYRDPLMAGEGHAEIDRLVQGVQAQFPGHTLRLAGGVDGFGDRVRCRWELVPEHGPAVVKATDFGVVVGGRLAEVTGFFDQVPA
jgi:hypothetical protein